MAKYICFWRGNEVEITANSSYDAQQKAQKHFGAKKGYEIAVVLSELNGEQVTHKPLF